jgi:thioesterase domain-containing protein
MSTPEPRPLPAPTLAALYPPIPGYSYFDAPPGWAFSGSGELKTAQQHWWLAEHALLAYASAKSIAPILSAQSYHSEFARDRASSSFAYAAIAADHGVLAFRGTEALKPGDSLRKLTAVARDWWIDARVAMVASSLGGQVHAGFQHALDALWPQLHAQLHRAPRWWLCGHSLGGALALLAAARLRDQGFDLAGVITFGQPRVGNLDCATQLQSLPLLRVVNACDLVPELPPEKLGYRHAGELLHLDADQRQNYAQTIGQFWKQLPGNLQYGVGALTPIELMDHAPLHYVVKCFNRACQS